MSESILTTIKKLLNIPEEYEHFDLDILTHINSEIFVLGQAGIGPKGFMVVDKTQTWKDYVGEEYQELAALKSYLYIKVKLIFDPPANSFTIDALNKTASEYLWRLNFDQEMKTSSVENGSTVE